MDNIVTNIPQAIRRERGQECNAPEDFIEFAIWCEALMAGVMPQDKNATSNKTSNKSKNDF